MSDIFAVVVLSLISPFFLGEGGGGLGQLCQNEPVKDHIPALNHYFAETSAALSSFNVAFGSGFYLISDMLTFCKYVFQKFLHGEFEKCI